MPVSVVIDGADEKVGAPGCQSLYIRHVHYEIDGRQVPFVEAEFEMLPDEVLALMGGGKLRLGIAGERWPIMHLSVTKPHK